MQIARENRQFDGEACPFTGAYEKQTVKELISNAKEVGDKKQIAINPLYVHIPSWQRDVRVAKAALIGSKYDSAKWDVPKVIVNQGRLYCVDGMHRIFGAYLAQIPSVVVEVLNISVIHAIDLFLSQTKDRTKMIPCDYFRAAIAAEKPDYVEFRKICTKNNVAIRGDNESPLDNPTGIFTSLSDGLTLTRLNPRLLDRILKLIGKLEWNGGKLSSGKAYSAKTIRVLKRLYGYYEGYEKEMEKCLLKNCKGSEYFRRSLSGMSQERIFDTLASVLVTNIPSRDEKVIEIQQVL